MCKVYHVCQDYASYAHKCDAGGKAREAGLPIPEFFKLLNAHPGSVKEV